MIVSLYGLFSDASSISRHLVLLSNILPPGTAELLTAQMVRIAIQSTETLGLAFQTSLLISLWSANAAMSALFDALNIVYKKRKSVRCGNSTPRRCSSRWLHFSSWLSRSLPL